MNPFRWTFTLIFAVITSAFFFHHTDCFTEGWAPLLMLAFDATAIILAIIDISFAMRRPTRRQHRVPLLANATVLLLAAGVNIHTLRRIGAAEDCTIEALPLPKPDES